MGTSTLHIMDNLEIYQERKKGPDIPGFLKNEEQISFTNKKLKAEKEEFENKQTAQYSVSPEGRVRMYGVLSNVLEKLSNVSFPLSTQNREDGDNELPEDAKELSVDLGCDITELLDDPLKMDDKEKIEEFISVHEQDTKEHAEKILPVTAKSHTSNKKSSPLERHTSNIHQGEHFEQSSPLSEALARGQLSNTLCLCIDSQVSGRSAHLLRDDQKIIIPQATNPQISLGSTLAGKDETDSLDSRSITQAETSQTQDGTSHSKKSTGGAKDCGKKTAGGGDSTEDKKTKNTKQQKENKSTSAGDSADISLPGSGDAGDGRRGDDGQGGGDDDKKNCKPTYVEEKEEEEEAEKKEEEEIDDVEKKISEKKEPERVENQDINEVDEQESFNLESYLKAAFQERAQQRHHLPPCPTSFSRSGEKCLQHLRQCSFGSLTYPDPNMDLCQECGQILRSLEQLILNTNENDALFLFPFYAEYIAQSNTQEGKHLILFKWVYENLPGKVLETEICLNRLKRIRISSSQGARPKKKLRVASRSHGQVEAMDTEPTPSPGIGDVYPRWNVVPRQMPKVIHGSVQHMQQMFENWKRNEEVTDGEVNEGVIFFKGLLPQCGCYRFQKEFRWMKNLGEGSYGKVFLASDNITNQVFVCKVVDEENFHKDEVLIWMQLDHPRIVPLWGVVRIGSKIYMFSEYFPSQTLKCRLGVSFPAHNLDYKEIIRQLLEVLEYIHSKNIVHMDIKPDNILYTDEGIFIIDWGLALKLNDNGQQQLDSLRGTELYAAPEVIECEPFDKTCDIWSAMCTILHVISGSPPWVKRFGELRTFQYVIVKKSPPIEDIPENTHRILKTFLIEGFGCKGYRPSATELLKNRIFFVDELSVHEEDIQIQPAQPPPDGLSEANVNQIRDEVQLPALNFSAQFRPIGETDNNSGSSLTQEVSPTSPECRMQDYPPLSNTINNLQLVGQISRPDSLPIGGASGVDKNEFIKPSSLERLLQKLKIKSTSESDDTGSHGMLDRDAIVDIDDEDLYGPGPVDEELVETLLRPVTTQESSLGQILSIEYNPHALQSEADIPQTPDRRSSCQSSVFDQFFQCLGSTPDTEDNSTSLGMCSPSSSRFQFQASGSWEQENQLKMLYSELGVQSGLTGFLQMEETSGFVTATTTTQEIPAPSEEDTVANSCSSAQLTIRIRGRQILVGCFASTYGDLAIGISPKVYEIFGEQIPRFILQDNAGNLFDVDAQVNLSCEITVVEAGEDMEWNWCVTPERVELRN